MKPEVKPFKYFAKSLDNGNYVIREAVRFEGHVETNFIYATYYDDWNQSIIREPIYAAADENELRKVLAVIAEFYNNNPEGILDFCTIE
jgi:hypothetical protein